MTHLEELVKHNFLVEEDVKGPIEKLDEKRFGEVLERLKKEKPFMVTKEVLKGVLAIEIDMIKQLKPVENLTVQDFVQTLNRRYSFIQEILLGKVELKSAVSINKVGSGTVSIIGLVKDILEKSSKRVVVLEDPTGYVEVLIDKKLTEKMALDDVVAVTGRLSGKAIMADKVFFPSVPLRPVNYSKESRTVAFAENAKADYVVSVGLIKDNIKGKKYKVNVPCMFKIEEVMILLMNGDPMEAINKRYLNIDKVDFLIDPVPDVILSDSKVSMSYKGISIVPKEKMIDLKNRQVADV